MINTEQHTPAAAALRAVADEWTQFVDWASAEGLIRESFGIRSTSSMCDVALKAWKAGRAALAAAPVQSDSPELHGIASASVQREAPPNEGRDAALADCDQVPYLIVYDDVDQVNEQVIGGTRARYRFKQISGSWNAHLFVKIASNSQDEKYPSATLATPAAQGDARDAAAIANKIVLDVAELDRDSPSDQPNMMLITADELRTSTIAAIASKRGVVNAANKFTPMSADGSLVFLAGNCGGFDVRNCPEPEALAGFIVESCNAAAIVPPAAAEVETIQQARANFEDWYTGHAADINAAPIGSRDSMLQWSSWIAARSGNYVARGGWKISPAPWGPAGAPVAAGNVDTCAEMGSLCSACDGTGEVHRADGEWMGECTCVHAWRQRAEKAEVRAKELEAQLARRGAPLSPETRQAIAAARAADQSIAAPRGGLVFMNDGAEPDYSKLDCPACGGSGHATDMPAGGAT